MSLLTRSGRPRRPAAFRAGALVLSSLDVIETSAKVRVRCFFSQAPIGPGAAIAGKGPDPRRDFIYFMDDGSLVGLRYDQWKIVFAEQREHGMNVWQEPFVPLRLPKLFSLRADPFETADHEGMDYERWRVEHLFVMVPAQAYVAKFLESFKDYPPRQKPGSFSIDQVMENMERASQGGAN